MPVLRILKRFTGVLVGRDIRSRCVAWLATSGEQGVTIGARSRAREGRQADTRKPFKLDLWTLKHAQRDARLTDAHLGESRERENALEGVLELASSDRVNEIHLLGRTVLTVWFVFWARSGCHGACTPSVRAI